MAQKQKEEDKTEVKEDDGPSVSFLDPYTIAWMNKRRPGKIGSQAALVTPSKALQLKSIFQGLDFDGSGEISLEEMQEAIKYVGETDASMNVDKINAFFVAMDTDGNGSIDYGEFLAAMSVDSGDVGSAEQSQKMQLAFFNFANKHRRQKLLDSLQDKSVPTPVRYKEFFKLFEFTSLQERNPGSIEEELLRAKQDAKKEKKEMGLEHWRRRRAEFARSRKAQLAFNIDRQVQDHGKWSFNSLIVANEIPNGPTFSKGAHKQLTKRLSNYRLNSAATYTPSLESVRSTDKMRQESMLLGQSLKRDQIIKQSLPPISMRMVASRSLSRKSKNRDRHAN